MDVARCDGIDEKDLNLTGKGSLQALRFLSCLTVHIQITGALPYKF